MLEKPRPILPLPPSVTDNLRATLTILTLTQAISELVQNSLDASSRLIRVQVNFLRSSCVVEDDGCGIPPEDVPFIGQRYGARMHMIPTLYILSLTLLKLLQTDSNIRTHLQLPQSTTLFNVLNLQALLATSASPLLL